MDISSDSNTSPPKRKRSVMWWIAGTLFVLVGLFLFQLLGPSPRIIVSPQTTFITTPLRQDGLPDFKHYLLGLYRDGVTPQSNAAPLIAISLWPFDLDPANHAAFAAELGFAEIPKASDALQDQVECIHEMVNAEYLHKHQNTEGSAQEAPELSNEEEADEIDLRTDKLSSRLVDRPWTAQEFPRIAKWVHDNQVQLDRLVEASQRPRCYFPSPSLLDNRDDFVVLDMMLPAQQAAREAGRSLMARAMFNIGEHRDVEAWRDLLAIQRLGRLVAQGPAMIEHMAGIEVANTGCDGIVQLLSTGNLTPEEARTLMRDLASLPPFAGMDDSLDKVERLVFIDIAIRLSRGEVDADSDESERIAPSVRFAHNLSVDWNVALRKGNEYFDRYVKASRLPTYATRHQALEQVRDDVISLPNRYGPAWFVSSTLTRSARSEVVAAILVHNLLVNTGTDMNYQEHANANLELTRVAAALAAYRADNGSYPEKLNDLSPAILDKQPVDIFNGVPFAYKRSDDGYLLYSLGPNGVDDGGSNEHERVYEGQRLDDLPNGDSLTSKIPTNADDLSIRVPLPPIEVPPLPKH